MCNIFCFVLTSTKTYGKTSGGYNLNWSDLWKGVQASEGWREARWPSPNVHPRAFIGQRQTEDPKRTVC